jgi:hypothetical protein
VVAALLELGQAVAVLVFSGAVAYWTGITYVVIAGLVFTTVLLLLIDAARRQIAATVALEDPPNITTAAISIVVMSIGLGAIWPAIPLIVGWGALHDDAEPRPRDRSRPR